jgi:plastocyanin
MNSSRYHGFVALSALLISTIMSMSLTLYSNHLLTAQRSDQTNNVTMANNSKQNSSSIINGFSLTSNGHNNVSIVPDASTLDDKAFQPNPIKIKVGDNITWTNNDTIPHTITSGTEGAANAGSEFDSIILATNQSFEHKFVSKGEFPYFCRVHPNMVGEAVVSD